MVDNNGAERSLREMAVGRRNWLFLKSGKGGQIGGNSHAFAESGGNRTQTGV